MKPAQASKSGHERNDVKRRDYLIQQEKLKSMAQSTTAKKALDADSMIENLLSRSETFAKHKDLSTQGLPPWLHCNSNLLPQNYKTVWQSVKSQSALGAPQYCHTQLLTSVLLTSGVPTDSLGHIWAMCNKTVPGSLTEQELYQVLALVALAQFGRPWNNLTYLQQVEEPVIPSLNYNMLVMNPPSADSGIHATYIPNTMSTMSIASPIQMFQNTTNNIISNSKASLELNPSLLETMFSSNFNQNPEGTSSTAPSLVNTTSKNGLSTNQSWKANSNDLLDNWTDFIDHTANSHHSNKPSVLDLKESNQAMENKYAAFENDPYLAINPSSKKNSNNLSNFSSNESRFDSLSTVVMDSSSNPTLIDYFSNKFSSIAISRTDNSENKKKDVENDDEFTDFQSFDYQKVNPVLSNVDKTSCEESNGNPKISSKVSGENPLKMDSLSLPKPTLRTNETFKDMFLSNESDDIVYGQKGYVVENPLYLSDNDSVHDNISVNSLKFDTFSFDTDPSQGSNLFLSNPSSFQTDKSQVNVGLESEKQNPLPEAFVQAPSLISTNVAEDKYSAFRVLEPLESSSVDESKVEDDDFGDFLTADITESKDSTVSAKESILDSSLPVFFSKENIAADQNSKLDYPVTQSLQEICLDACISALRHAVDKFSSLNTGVLKLVLCEDKCIDYIQALTEIYRIAERIVQSPDYDVLKEKLSIVWTDLNSYVSTKFSVEECEEENDYNCTLCCASSGSAVIKYGTSYYHVPCINFYLNCINSNLPD